LEPKELSLTFKISGVLLFLLFAIVAFYWFYIYLALLFEGIFYHQDIIVFNKSAMYMLGVGIFCFLVTISLFKAYITNKRIPDTKIYAYGVFYIPLLLMITLPHIISFFVHQHIDKINYIECREQSTIKIKYTEIVFAKDLGACTQYKR
jgi:hypothetical protein